MTTTRRPRTVRCDNCQPFGHIRRHCTNAKQQRYSTPKRCSLHNSTTPSDAECKVQKGQRDAKHPPQNQVTNTPPQGEVHSVHTMTGQTPTEEEDFGHAFSISPPASQGEADALLRPRPVSQFDTWMNLQHFVLSVPTIFVGVWGLFHQGYNGIAQMANLGMPTTCKSSDDTNGMTMLVDSGASGHYFDDEVHPNQKNKLLNYQELVRPH